MKSELLIPVRRVERMRGRFAWGEAISLVSAYAEDRLPLRQLAADLRRELKCSARLGRVSSLPCALIVRRDNRIRHHDGYRISIQTSGIEIASRTTAGTYYAVQTLRELVRINGKTIPCCRISDHPDFVRRGVYLDCSRGKVPTVDTLKLLIEYLASCKINELELYIENVFAFASHPEIGKGFSSFTPDDLLNVQEHCRLHHVRFVPSLASFGHMEKILGLPEFQHLGEMPGFRGLPGGTTLYPGDPASIRLMADLYGDFLPLFDSVDFNACGDEPWELGKGRSKRRAKRTGVGRVYLDFILKLHRLCERHGKRMNLWADIVLNHPELIPEIPGDIVMLNWCYESGGALVGRTPELSNAGLSVVVCPGTSGWRSHGTRLKNATRNVAEFAAEGRRCGAEGLLNTDWGDGGHRNPIGVSFHGFAHGAAHAWNGRAVDDARFTEIFSRHVLGDSGSAAAIRAIGSTQDRAGATLYDTITESMRGGDFLRGMSPITPVGMWPTYRGESLTTASEKGCRRVVDQLAAARRLLNASRGGAAVCRLVREDLKLAADLDSLACRKILTARAAKNGETVPLKTLRKLAGDTRRVAERFESNWLKRNRPSRLKDNLKLFERSAGEMRMVMHNAPKPSTRRRAANS